MGLCFVIIPPWAVYLYKMCIYIYMYDIYLLIKPILKIETVKVDLSVYYQKLRL